jgi:hypothetical protein
MWKEELVATFETLCRHVASSLGETTRAHLLKPSGNFTYDQV